MTDKEKESRPESSEQLPVAKNFDVLSPSEDLVDFCRESRLAYKAMPNSEHNLTLPENLRPGVGDESMYEEFYGQEPRKILAHLLKFIDLGFKTEIHYDAYSTQVHDGEFDIIPTLDSKKMRHKKSVTLISERRMKKLSDKGATVTETNPIKNYLDKLTFPLTKRNHRKIRFIKTPSRSVCWIKGMNTASIHWGMIDYSVKFTDPRIVDVIINQFSNITEDKQSVEIPCTEDTSILEDAGGDKESIILKKVIEDIDRANETVYAMSALEPEGEYREALLKAIARGRHVVFVTTNPVLMQGALKVRHIVFDQLDKVKRVGKIPKIYPREKLVHGKMTIIDEKIAHGGSHNYTKTPHRELNFRSTNQTLVNNMIGFLKRTIGEDNLKKELTENLVVSIQESITS